MFSLQGPKSEDDVGDGAEAVDHEPDELSGYEPESDVNTMTVPVLYLVALFFYTIQFVFLACCDFPPARQSYSRND